MLLVSCSATAVTEKPFHAGFPPAASVNESESAFLAPASCASLTQPRAEAEPGSKCRRGFGPLGPIVSQQSAQGCQRTTAPCQSSARCGQEARDPRGGADEGLLRHASENGRGLQSLWARGRRLASHRQNRTADAPSGANPSSPLPFPPHLTSPPPPPVCISTAHVSYRLSLCSETPSNPQQIKNLLFMIRRKATKMVLL